MGEVAPHGTILFKGQNIAGLPSYRIARLGLGYVPENRDIFPGLTVRQNLLLGVKDTRRPGKWRLDDMLDMFSNLKARADTAAGVLSGGEKQMLTICRTLMGDPELIMIDEPTEGLAPLIVHQVGDLIAEIARRGVAILLVEQKLAIAMRISHRLYVMGHGRIVFEGTPDDLKANQTVRPRMAGGVRRGRCEGLGLVEERPRFFHNVIRTAREAPIRKSRRTEKDSGFAAARRPRMTLRIQR